MLLKWMEIIFFSSITIQIILGNSNEIIIWKGQDLILVCSYNITDDDDVAWMRNREEVEPLGNISYSLDSRETHGNGILHIQGADERDEGNYSCQIGANNSVVESHWFVVRVKDFRCPPFELIANGSIQYIRLTDNGDDDRINGTSEYVFTNGTIAVFECQEGFIMNGSDQSVCRLEYEGWSNQLPSCLLKKDDEKEYEIDESNEDQINSTHFVEKLTIYASTLKDLKFQLEELMKEINFTGVGFIHSDTPHPDAHIEKLYQNLRYLENKFQISIQALIEQQMDFRKRMEMDLAFLRENSISSVSKLESRLNYHVQNMDTFYKTTQKQLENQIQILAKQQDEQQQWAEDELKVIKSSHAVLLNRLENSLISQMKASESNYQSEFSTMESSLHNLENRLEERSRSEELKYNLLEGTLKAVGSMASSNSNSMTSLAERLLNVTLMRNRLLGNRTVLEIVWNVENAEESLKTEKMIFYPFYTGIPGYKLALDIRPGNNPFITVYLRIFAGQFDDELRWPAFYDCELAIISKDKESTKDIIEKTKGLKLSPPRDKYVDSFLTSVADMEPPHIKDENSPFVLDGQLTIRLRLNKSKN